MEIVRKQENDENKEGEGNEACLGDQSQLTAACEDSCFHKKDNLLNVCN